MYTSVRTLLPLSSWKAFVACENRMVFFAHHGFGGVIWKGENLGRNPITSWYGHRSIQIRWKVA